MIYMSVSFVEEKVTVSGKYALKGTMTIPAGDEGKYPAVLIISGSGKITRDGNAGKKINFNIYRELAESIAKLGFVTLRYDKRGVGESEGNYLETGLWDLVDDVRANIGFLKSHPTVDPEKIILLGHSEGCMLATITNSRYPVDGLILLAGAAETLKDATSRQRNLLYEEIQHSKGFKFALLRLLKADKKGEAQSQKFFQKVMESNRDVMRQGLVKINAKWIREHFSHNVVDDLKKAVCPVLAVTGSKDFQTNPECVKVVPELVQGEAEVHIVENMNHILKEYHGEITVLDAKKQYSKAQSQPIHPELQKILQNWLVKHFCHGVCLSQHQV